MTTPGGHTHSVARTCTHVHKGDTSKAAWWSSHLVVLSEGSPRVQGLSKQSLRREWSQHGFLPRHFPSSTSFALQPPWRVRTQLLKLPEKFEQPRLAFTQQANCSLPSDFYLQDISGIGDLKNTLKLKSSCREGRTYKTLHRKVLNRTRDLLVLKHSANHLTSVPLK